MSSPSPWSIKGIPPEARKLAKEAAQKRGMTLGQWLSDQIAAAALSDDDDAPAKAVHGAVSAPPLNETETPPAAASADRAPLDLDVEALEQKLSETLSQQAVAIEERLRSGLGEVLKASIDATFTEERSAIAAEAEQHREELESIEESVKTLITQLNGRITRTVEQNERLGARLTELGEIVEADAARNVRTEAALGRVAEAIEAISDEVRRTQSVAQDSAETARAAMIEARANNTIETVDTAMIEERIEAVLERMLTPSAFAAIADSAEPTADVAQETATGESIDWPSLEVPVTPMPSYEAAETFEDSYPETTTASAFAEQDHAGEPAAETAPTPDAAEEQLAFDDVMPRFVDPEPSRRLEGGASLQRALHRLDESHAQETVEPAPYETAPASNADAALLDASAAHLASVAAEPAVWTDEEDDAENDWRFPEADGADANASDVAEAPVAAAPEAPADADAPTGANQKALLKLLREPEDEWLVVRPDAEAEQDQATPRAAQSERPRAEERREPTLSDDPFDIAFGVGGAIDQREADPFSATDDDAVLALAPEDSVDAQPHGHEPEPLGWGDAPDDAPEAAPLQLSASQALDAPSAPQAEAAQPNPYRRKPIAWTDDEDDLDERAESAPSDIGASAAADYAFAEHSPAFGEAQTSGYAAFDDELNAYAVEIADAEAEPEVDDALTAEADALDDWDVMDDIADAAPTSAEQTETASPATDAGPGAAAAEDAETDAVDDLLEEEEDFLDDIVDWETGATNVKISAKAAPTVDSPRPGAAAARAMSAPARSVAAPAPAARPAETAPTAPSAELPQSDVADEPGFAEAAFASDFDAEDDGLAIKKSGLAPAAASKSLLSRLTRRKSGAPEAPTRLEPEAPAAIDEEEPHPAANAWSAREKPPRRQPARDPLDAAASDDAELAQLDALYDELTPTEPSRAAKVGLALSLALMAVTAAASVAYIYMQGF